MPGRLLVALAIALLVASLAAAPALGAAEQPPNPAAPAPVPVDIRTQPVPAPRTPGADPVVASPQPFAMVGLSWMGTAPDVLAIRARHLDGGWGEWINLEAADGQPAARSAQPATEPVWVGPSRELQVRSVRAGQPTPDVRAVLVDPGKAPADAAPPQQPQDPGPIVTREGWGADERIRCGEPKYDDSVRAITLHHTAESNNYGPDDSARIVRGIYAYHARTLGWCDIGYNALVDRFGQVFEGRAGGLDRAVIGAHAGGFNRFTSGVAVMGTFTRDEVPAPSVDALRRFVAWKVQLHRLDPFGRVTLVSSGGGTSKYRSGSKADVPVIFGHREVGNTICPGEGGMAILEGLRSGALPAPAPPPPPPPPAPVT